MPGTTNRKRPGSAVELNGAVKKSKLANGRSVSRISSRKSEESSRKGKDYSSGEGEGSYGSDSEEEKMMKRVPSGGMDLSELLGSDDDAPVTEAQSNRPTLEHVNMLKTLRSELGMDYAAQRAKMIAAAREMVPAARENAFQVSVEGASKVDLNELMEAAGSVGKETAKQLEKLNSSDRRLLPEVSKQRKARAERTVQYEDTKQVLSSWMPTVQSMRQTESLVFPLPEQLPEKVKRSTTTMAVDYTPQTELEKAVYGILEESGVTEEKVRTAEALAAKKLNVVEMKEKQAQLAKMRSLFFFQEQKHKRQAKIKSKKYRKIFKKAKEKNMPTLAELEELDPEAFHAELEKIDKARALERMGIKHRNLGTWAKKALRSKDPNTMAAVREHLEHGRSLLKKMQSDKDNSDEDDDSDASSIHSSDLDNSDQEGDLQDDDQQDEGDIIDIHGNRVSLKKKNEKTDDSAPSDGVFAMRFMQRASARKEAEHHSLMNQMDHDYTEQKQKLIAQRKKAKDDFTEKGLKAQSSDEEDDNDDEEVKTLKKETKMEVEIGQGRKKIVANNSQIAATVKLQQMDQDEDSDIEFASSSLLVDRDVGFASHIKTSMTVEGKSMKSVRSDESDAYDASDGEATTFVPNKHNYEDTLPETNAKDKNKKQPQQKKNVEPVKKSKSSSVDESVLLIDPAFAAPKRSSQLVSNTTTAEEDSDGDELLIPLSRNGNSQTSKNGKSSKSGSSSSNPWMTMENDEEDDVKASKTQAVAVQKKKKKLNQDSMAVDLERVQKQLQEDEKNQEAVFNLSAAGATSKSQRELINRAFASDHVTEAEFDAEKLAAVEEANEVEKEYATLTMPGWGEWAGTGVKPSARRQRILKEVEEKKAARAEELMAARQDAKLKHAMISSKQPKQFAKYQTANVPRQFKDNSQIYEASLRQPLGKEWNARAAHATLVKPKVVVRPGIAIEPLQKKREGITRPQ